MVPRILDVSVAASGSDLEHGFFESSLYDQSPTQDQLPNSGQFTGKNAVMIDTRAYFADRRMRLRERRAGLERSKKIDCLSGCASLDGEDVCGIGNHLLQLQRRSHAHGDIVFFVPRSRDRVD